MALLVIAGALVYAASLPYPFVFDDQMTIVENTSIRDWTSSRVLTPDREIPTAGRPIVNVSHALNYAAGGLDPSGYRAINLLWHLLCALMVFAVGRRTLDMPRVPEALRRHATGVAWGAALLWTVHPLNTEVVEYITERSESMMALAYLLTIYAAVRALGSRHGRLWTAAAVGVCAIGMACKESMVTAPVAVWLYDRTFVYGTWSAALRARWRLYAGLVATWALLAAVIWSGPRVYSAGFSTAVSPWTYLLNQAVMIPHYLRLVVWPHGLVVAYGPPLPLVLSDVLPDALLVVALVVLTAIALVRWPLVGFVGAWLFVTLSPTSSVLPIATEVGAERRMYLALIPLAVLFVTIIFMLADRYTRRNPARSALTITAAVAIALAAASLVRVREYASSLGLAETVLQRRPSSFAHAIVGTQLAVAGRHDEAIAELRIAAPGYPLAHYHLGGELFNRGQPAAALPELQAFVQLEPWRAEAVPARTMIGRAFMLERKWPEAAEQQRLVLGMTPPRGAMHTTALGFLADSLFAQQKFDEARDAYLQYLALRPDDVGALTNLGVSLSATGKIDEAVSAFRRAVEMRPGDPQSQRNLAIALDEQGHRPAR